MTKLSTAAFTGFALLCFAGNSLLCRAALGGSRIDAGSFTLVRMLFGSVALLVLVGLRGAPLFRRPSWSSAVSLVGYAAFFSLAYVQIDAGVGALILFGAVQITMFGWNAVKHGSPKVGEWIGAAIALSGLAVLTVPGKHAPPILGAGLMAAAGIAWGAYSLLGRGAVNPLLVTTDNFTWGTLIALPLYFLLRPLTPQVGITQEGIALAAVSGAITSGIGYSLWYRALPHLGRNFSALLQLTVPIVAAVGAMIWLGEPMTPRLLMSGLLVLGGISFVFLKR